MKAAGRAFLTEPPETVGTFSAARPGSREWHFQRTLGAGPRTDGKGGAASFLIIISGLASNSPRVNPSAAATRGYSYLAPEPIDEPNWAFAVDGDEFPLTVISWGCSLKTAVFLLPVVRSIASEHKARMPPRSTAIIRRRMEAVIAVAPGYPPQPTKAVFSSAAGARNGCDQTISTPRD